MAKDAAKQPTQGTDAEDTSVEQFKLDHEPEPAAEAARKSRRKTVLPIEDWKRVAARVVHARQVLQDALATLSESCNGQQVAPIQSAIDRINLAMLRLDTVAYGQHKHAGSGLFSVPSPSDDSGEV